MKKTILAVALASLFVGSASAATVYKNDSGDNLKVYGGMEIGGTFVADKDKGAFKSNKTYVDDSFLTIGAKGQTGDIFAKFELDAERTDWTVDNNFRLVIDKAYIGYNIAPKHSIEVGRTDTAYDHYDAFGDFSNELAAEVSEAGDQDNTIKYRGQFGSVKVGVSHSLEGWDAETDGKGKVTKGYITDSREGKVTNGYVGYFAEQFTVIAAAETVDDRGELYSLHAEASFDKFGIGGFVSSSDKEKDQDDSMTYVLSAKYGITEQLTLLAVGNVVDHDQDKKDDEWVVVGGEYKYAKNVKLAAEIAAGGEKGTLGYVKAYYWF
ncbi:porin [uncultured Photobacterium sp.]|uniref:porin n=1 Tax=uncultured Photobacterium sp. TaxID=173973 RepID=UPI0026343BCF|nr:porin [uncultured Photobacterium sp.]